MPILDRPDARIAYEVAGTGQPVLLIQGVGVTGSGWGPQVEGLRHRFAVATFDNRGIGKSLPLRGSVTIEAMAEDAAAVLDALGWESAHVMGHSMGGIIAQQFALAFPQRTRSLVLQCTTSRGPDAARLTPRLLGLGLRARIGTRAMRRRAFLEMLYPDACLDTVDVPRLAEETGALIGRDLADQPNVVFRQVRAMAKHDAEHRLGELKGIPTLVMAGAHDPIGRPECGRRLAAAIPGAVYEEYADASHGLPLHFPDQVNARLLAFLESIKGAAIPEA